jgi:NADPH2:quinone reductase
MAWWLMGKRVACFGDGTWAEYIAIDVMRCIPLNSSTSWENAAGAIANPITVIVMLDVCKDEKMVVATAGSSGLTSQFIRAAKSKGIETIAIVRKEDQIESCQKNGAFATLNSEAEGFQEKLAALCKDHKVRIAFDSVAGDAGSKVFASLINGGEMHVYGFLSGKPLNVPASELIFKQKELKGLWLNSALKGGIFKFLRIKNQLLSMIDNELRTTTQATFSLDQIVDALLCYTSNLSGGKVQLIIGDAEKEKV